MQRVLQALLILNIVAMAICCTLLLVTANEFRKDIDGMFRWRKDSEQRRHLFETYEIRPQTQHTIEPSLQHAPEVE